MRYCGFTIFFIVIIQGYALGASFDCNKASTPLEKMICADQELSKLDVSLENAFNNVKERVGIYAVREQRDWLMFRDSFENKDTIKHLYKVRIDQLENPNYIQSPYFGTGLGKDAPSYFSTVSDKSIAEIIDGCFADEACASYFSMLITDDSTKESVADCNKNQKTMNVCAGLRMKALMCELADVTFANTEPSGDACEIAVQRDQYEWARNSSKECSRKASEKTGGGSAYGSVYNSCLSEMYKERIAFFRSIDSCSPCSKCLNIP